MRLCEIYNCIYRIKQLTLLIVGYDNYLFEYPLKVDIKMAENAQDDQMEENGKEALIEPNKDQFDIYQCIKVCKYRIYILLS